MKMVWSAGQYVRMASMALLLAGCSERKDLSPPEVNAKPRDKLELIVTVEGRGSDFPATVIAQYGNLSRDCSNVEYRYGLGGNIDYPKGDVPVTRENGVFEIYKDYYKPKEKCSWDLLSVGIVIHAPNGRHASTGISRRDFQAGFRSGYKCLFIRNDVNSCVGLTASNKHLPGVDVLIQVK
jgi:hypothetical protein